MKKLNLTPSDYILEEPYVEAVNKLLHHDLIMFTQQDFKILPYFNSAAYAIQDFLKFGTSEIVSRGFIENIVNERFK